MSKRYLELNGTKWRVVVAVPRPLHAVLGTKLKRTLNTTSLALANRLKWAIVSEFQEEIARASTGKTDGSGKAVDPITAEALALRESIEQAADDRARQDVIEYVARRADEIAGDPIEVADENSGKRVFEYDSKRASIAGIFSRLATGESTPLRSFVAQWHGQSARHPRVMKDDERALELLEVWCREHRVDAAIEAVTRKVAGSFIGELLDEGSRTPRTINKYISSLSGYWKWLKRRGHVDENVWREQSLPKAKSAAGSARAFTDEEVRRLLNGETSEYLHDLMRIAALSGARIDPIASLKVADCQDGLFKFKPQKKEPGPRYVPIHSALVSLVERRCAGKGMDDDLFPELPIPPAGSERERSMPAVKLFGRYRKAVGVDEQLPGQRRSLVTFHSFRRWFITRAERAGQPETIIAAVVGHKRAGMTLGLYSAGPDREQFTRCVESVTLP
ncbi:tyrosine-type recombinase/integrase [Bradyrhizobium sp. 182]|uniref:tyrosine-type recombinase/integrase n=1 Tax=Bradyrhizobium sp. 182 TaxID=2782651 RepID=UPI001FF98D03|nr:tyrosine-type recombinase/integrase [Bradyrhizobium sp. 182]MCK1531165.1 tyrosine-type recombinase/integrase [Bradyrhizobium sp. 182]